QQGGGQRGHVQLALGLAAGDVAEVEGLDRGRGDVRVEDRVGGGLGEELGAGAIVLAKLGDAHSDHGDAAHAVSSAKVGGSVGFHHTAPRYMNSKSNRNRGTAWYGGPHDTGRIGPRRRVTVEEALLALLAAVAIVLLFLGLPGGPRGGRPRRPP